MYTLCIGACMVLLNILTAPYNIYYRLFFGSFLGKYYNDITIKRHTLIYSCQLTEGVMQCRRRHETHINLQLSVN